MKNLRIILLIITVVTFLSLLQAKLYADTHYLIDESGFTEETIIADKENLPDFLVSDNSSPEADIKQDYEVQRFREIQLSRELTEAGKLVHGDKVTLNLFDDVQYTGSLDRTNININGTYSLRVRLDDYQLGYMLMSTTQERTLAKIRIPENNEFYLIKSDPVTFRHYLLDIGDDNRHHLESGPPLIPEDEDIRERRRDDTEGIRHNLEDNTPQSRNPQPQDPALIDLMIVYTTTAKAWADQEGGGIDNVIAQTMENSQLVHDNSGTGITLYLVHSDSISYNESGNSGLDLQRMTSTTYQGTREVHELRDEHGADLIALLARVSDVGGVAWLLTRPHGHPERGFSLTRVQQAAATYTFAHELGHNMGAGHHRAQNFQPGPGIFNYSAGWRWTGGDNRRYCTIMTYTSGQYFYDGLNHSHVPYFSNPDIFYEDDATGHAIFGDNARTLSETKHPIANYRETVFVIEDYPWSESFAEEVFPPLRWQVVTASGDGQWQRSSGGHDNNPPPAAEGEFNALFYAGDDRGSRGGLITPELDLSGRINRQLSFSHAQAARDGNHDILNVFYRESRHDEWIRIAFYEEETADWTLRTINLPDTLDTMFIKFEATSDNGYGTAVDNITVDSDLAADFPVAASNPYPVNDSISVSVNLESLSWDYIDEADYAEPVGFRVYFGTDAEFGGDDNYDWVPYEEGQARYYTAEILPELEIGRRYYWLVIPTTDDDDDGRKGDDRRRGSVAAGRNNQQYNYRNDAANCPVWSFWTEGPLVQVSGRVTGNDAPEGLVDALVYFSNGSDTFRVETGNNGEFVINDVEGSSDGLPYDLRITNDGYQPHASRQQVMAEPLNLGDIRLAELAWEPRNLVTEISVDGHRVILNWEAPLPGRAAGFNSQSPVLSSIASHPQASLSFDEKRNINNSRQRRKTNERSSGLEQDRELEGYRIYRFVIYDEENYDDWSYLGYIEDTVYSDTLWVELDYGRYKYAVRAVYTNDVFSGFINSDIVKKEFSGGSGNEQDPWLVSSVDELNMIRYYTGAEHRDKHFKQTANLDFAGTAWSDGKGWLPIGSSASQFQGHYDGNGLLIDNLMINRWDLNNVGLFGYCRDATLKNISVINADVAGGRWVGVLVGDFTGDDITAEIINCFTSGSVTGIDRVGGLAGYLINADIISSYATTAVTGIDFGQIGAGGLVGFLNTGSTVSNSFADGEINVENNGSHVGSLVGRLRESSVTNSFAVGNVSAEREAGGLIGGEADAVVNNCYWDMQTTQQEESAGGSGRTTAQMTFPYDDETYIDWDFQDIWMEDVNSVINSGYPFLRHFYSESPKIAGYPSPADDSSGVSVYLEELSWSYFSEPTFADPLGFRVYFNETGEFGEDDDFAWIPYEDEQANYANSDILPEKLDYYTEYFWKVVPTTEQPGRNLGNQSRKQRINQSRDFSRYRDDAENCPVWSFKTEKNPQPIIASIPYPADKSVDISVDLDSLRWSYEIDASHVEPAGFKVYLNTTGKFAEDDDYDWIDFCSETNEFASTELLTELLEYKTAYYWQVVPAVEGSDRRANNANYSGRNSKRATRNREERNERFNQLPVKRRGQVNPQYRSSSSPARLSLQYENGLKPEVWSFTTEKETYTDAVPELVTSLNKNYPNPFNPETIIGFSLAEPGNVIVDIFNSKGQKVRTVINNEFEKGHHRIVWDGLAENDRPLGSGIYFYRLKTKDYTEVRKMIMLR